MKHLDNFAMVAKRIEELDLSTVLMPYELKEYNALSPLKREEKLRNICEKPIFDFSVINRLYFRLKWLDVMKAHGGGAVRVLEIGSGSSDNIPATMAVHDAGSEYITANMNKELTRGLISSTSSLPITIRVIEDDAANIKSHLPPDSVDIVVFEHSVNDVLQVMLAEGEGIDTSARDWFEILPEMIRLINAQYRAGILEQSLKQPFLRLVRSCLDVLKSGGMVAMSHHMFKYDLDLGYDPFLWENMLPVVRPWLRELSELEEISVDGFDAQWWLFFRKV